MSCIICPWGSEYEKKNFAGNHWLLMVFQFEISPRMFPSKNHLTLQSPRLFSTLLGEFFVFIPNFLPIGDIGVEMQYSARDSYLNGFNCIVYLWRWIFLAIEVGVLNYKKMTDQGECLASLIMYSVLYNTETGCYSP